MYTAAPGDTVYSIAARQGISTRALYRNNLQLGGRSELQPGEQLVISYEDNERLGQIGVNGYAYPFIDAALLDSAGPFLSYLTPFTNGLSREGGLLPFLVFSC